MREYDFHDDLDDFADDSFHRRRPRHRSAQTQPSRRGRLTERERARLATRREDELSEDNQPTHGDRWSTWGEAAHGPKPRPPWVITELVAQDSELGLLKTGKEADVHLLRREIAGTPRSCLLAAKRYRGEDHRLFHRDAQYLEGRRMRRSRETRAMARRTSFGRNLIAEQWATAEFDALCRLWSSGVMVPYPVQRNGSELLLEFIGDADGTAAPRLAQLRLDSARLRTLWYRVEAALLALARLGLCHGDLSAYNVLVHNGQPVLIDLPQVVDLTINPQGLAFLDRDVRNIVGWFAAQGLPSEVADPAAVTTLLVDAAGLIMDTDRRSDTLREAP